MKKIELTQGKYALVDDEDFEYINQFNWNFHPEGYAQRSQRIPGTRKNKNFRMHREIMQATPGVNVDHKDGDGLNNQRKNLRFATQQQNMRNRKPNRKSGSKYKGVHWHKGAQKWKAQIGVDGKRIHLGLFDTEIEAARAYDEAALDYFDNYASLNIQ